MSKERLKSPRARLFVALDLPEEVSAGLAAWQREWRDPALRAMRPETIHITLAFLGWQRERDIDAIAEASFEVDAEAPLVRLEPEPVSVPRGKHPRLFALDADSPGAVELQAQVEAVLVRSRFYEPEKRPFWPHLTVARVKRERRGSKRPATVEAPPGPLPAEMPLVFRPTRLRLYRSYVRPQGAEYVSLAEHELPAPDSSDRREVD